MEPSPSLVSETVTAMITSAWPTTQKESREWLRRHGIDPDTATERARRDPGRNWDRARTLGWGSADAGWGTFRGEFVGANWFLWRDSSSTEVMAAAQTLADLPRSEAQEEHARAHRSQRPTPFALPDQ